MAKIRLNKILAQAGLTSRRGAERLLAEGRVAVNGLVVREAGALADQDADRITVDGRPLPAAATKHYLVLHKPRGYVSTLFDPEGRPAVVQLIGVNARLYPVGRLDWDVEGVLLMTNDGALTHRLLHPRYALPRVYEAEVTGILTRADAARWRSGVVLDDGPAVPSDVQIVRAGRTSSLVRLTFAEGRKHEVKRYCQALGHPVRRLRRIAFGPIELGELPLGQSRPLTTAEITALRAAAAAPGPSRRRGSRTPK